jgi:hypothetical protein
MQQTSANRGKSGKAYVEWLKLDLGRMIDELGLSDLRKQMLRSRWLDQVIWMEGQANRTQNWHYGLRLTAIIGGILVPICVTVGQVPSLAWVTWVATALGALVAIASAVEGFFHYGERWRNYRNTGELLKIEGWQFFQLSGPYSHSSHAQAYEKFAARVEEIISSDVQTYISQIMAEREPEQGEDETEGDPSA